MAIAGPTGAGKSSLLDALIFALYGRVPRLSARSVTDMISLGRDTLYVVLDFRYGDKTYRVSRTADRTRPAKAQIEELLADGEQPLADGVRAVDSAVEEILGLGYEAFTQAVILPQGQFAKFLQSQPRERRQILTDLLRLQVYERMRERATREAMRLEALAEAKTMLLAQYADATPEALVRCQEALEERHGEALATRERLSHQSKHLVVLRERHAATGEARRQRAALTQLQRQGPDIAVAQAQLEAARRAEAVAPRLESAAAASDSVAAAARALGLAQAELEAAQAAELAAAGALQEAERAAAELPALGQRLQALDRVCGLVEPLQAARQRAAAASREAAAREADLKRAQAGLTAAQQQDAHGQAELVRLRGLCQAVGYAVATHRELEALQEPAAALTRAREHAARLELEFAAAARAVASAQAECLRQAPLVTAAALRLSAAERDQAAADDALRQLEREHAAAHLRANLRKGDPCPVCERAVAKLPGVIVFGSVDDAQRAAEAARQHTLQARAQHAEQQRLAERQAAVAEQAEAARGRLEVSLIEAQSAHERARQALLDGPGAAALAGEDEPDVTLRALLKAHEQARTRHEAASAALERAQHAAQAATHAAEAAGVRVGAMQQAVADARRRASESGAEAAALEAAVHAVTRDPEPAAERARLAAESDRVAAALAQAARAQAGRAQALAAADAGALAARAALATARTADAAAQASVAAALAEAGFSASAEAQAAIRSAAAQAALARRIEIHERERHALERRLDELRAALADGEVDDAALAAAVAEAERLEVALQELARDEAGLEHRRQDIVERRARAVTLEQEQRALGASQRRQRQLATDLRSENFQAYVLEETFRDLVTGASARLYTLSGRYTLAFHADRFHVLDHDNARERRPVDTLSGGETFLASLALALELSQQIQRAAGAVHLESLFIDEGFGTLDPETLETVTDAIFKLPTSGRLVGIITHLPELTERMPARIQIEKTPSGSRLSVSRG